MIVQLREGARVSECEANLVFALDSRAAGPSIVAVFGVRGSAAARDVEGARTVCETRTSEYGRGHAELLETGSAAATLGMRRRT
jgi:hypothetical protein